MICEETISLSKPGEPNRTVRCRKVKEHLHRTPCEGKVTLSTFEGEVVATIEWYPVVRASSESANT